MAETETTPVQPAPTEPETAAAEYSTGKQRRGGSQPSSWTGLWGRLPQRMLVTGLAVGVVGGMFGSFIFIHYFAASIPVDRKQTIIQESSAVTDVANKVSPSVVSITTKQVAAGFFGNPVTETGAGTGMIVTANGLILTNKHVVPDGTSAVTVITSDGKQYSGSVVARDTINDIAFVRISASGLKPVTLGDSGNVKVGEKVVAIGNALGQFQNSVTEGIISGVSREITAGDQSSGSSEELQNVFQTDAAINPGNSGGPLVNLDGQVIGMNTAVAGQNAQNIGFAIPINDIKGDIVSMETNGKVIRPYLGVRFVALTKDVAAANNLSVSDGAWLQSDSTTPAVVPGSPAEKAGLKAGDVITKVGGTTIDSTHSLVTLLSSHKVGDKVALTVLRDGKTQTINVTLEAAPNS